MLRGGMDRPDMRKMTATHNSRMDHSLCISPPWRATLGKAHASTITTPMPMRNCSRAVSVIDVL